MRRMSFSLTTAQMRAGTKTVTRRLAWSNLRVGEMILAVEKAMGLRKGEKQVEIGVIQITSIVILPLSLMTREDLADEGFPRYTREQFIDLFCKANRCAKDTLVRVIRFRHVSPASSSSAPVAPSRENPDSRQGATTAKDEQYRDLDSSCGE